MKARRIVDSVRKNWLPIVVCVALALPFYMFYLFSTMDRKSFIVPLAIDAQNGMVAASPFPRTVRVMVRGKPESISTLHESDFSAYLDLNYVAREGESSFPVLITLSENAMLIEPMEIRVSPEEVLLTVEEQISAFVPVSALISGEPAHGYEKGAVTLNPDEAKVTGPRSMVEHCTRLQTRQVSVDGARGDVTAKVSLDNPGIFLKVAQGTVVSVTVKVAEAMTTRTFASVPVQFSALNGTLEPAESIAPITLTLRGSVLVLEQYRPGVSTVLADCSGISSAGTHTVPLRFSLPAGVTAENGARSVSVTVAARSLEPDAGSAQGGGGE